MVVAQPVSAPLTRAAIFLVVMINPGPENRAAVRSFCADVGGLIRAVEFRDLEAGLSCVIGIGSDAWDRLFPAPWQAFALLPRSPACPHSVGAAKQMFVLKSQVFTDRT